MKQIILTLCLSFALVGLAAQSQAKPLSRIIAESGLSPEDFQLMQQAMGQLVVNGVPQVGKTVAWDNPATKSSGSVTLQEMRDNCGFLQQLAHPKGAEQPVQIRSRMCQQADGKWLLVP
ncbi:hypothetical protein M3P21_09935 [Ruegeria sp. 2012CJ41-6]|uniref:Surface antigen domain-containing protein n=1 Tax=Ruegeria spongiae TaxID=2942209 RepID=A0ABT0Q225_9RHOB|nr:hypothetical protein [Ruegeria spongiae]MCL6283848.1 hypothetical protein [Ruegeria spongiae]